MRNSNGTFAAGNSGKPKGARNKLGEQFLKDLLADWEKNGTDIIERARQDRPMEYVRMIASLLPKELLIATNPLDDLTDEALADMIEALQGLIKSNGLPN